jgi:hypothetical protein
LSRQCVRGHDGAPVWHWAQQKEGGTVAALFLRVFADSVKK